MDQQQQQIEIDDKLDWATLLEIVRTKNDLNNQRFIVKYIDDENEEIDINSQNEFENAFMFAALTNNRLRFIIKAPNGNKIDEINMKVNQIKVEQPVKIQVPVPQQQPIKIQEPVNVAVVKEERLINFENPFDISTMINSRINNAVALNTSSDAFDEKNPPKWFVEAIQNLKIDILSEIDTKLQSLNDKIEEIKQSNTTILSNAATVAIEATTPTVLTLEIVQKLIDQYENAKVLEDFAKVKEIEDKLATLSPFSAKFIRDCNIPDGTQFEANSKFKKSWLLQNNGQLAWTETKINLINIAGNIYCVNKSVAVKNVDVNGLFEVEVELIAPEKPGLYLSEWVLSYQNYLFGPRIWCAIEVVDMKSSQLKIDIPPQTMSNQQESPLILSPSSFASERKLSSSTRLSEKMKDIIDLSDDDDDTEFVIIPDCLDLTKKWEPLIKTKEVNVVDEDEDDDDCSIKPINEEQVFLQPESSQSQQQQQQEQEQINSRSTMMLINELLLIPKRQDQLEERLQNLMTFSSSMHDAATTSNLKTNINHVNESFEINDISNGTADLNETDEKNLLIFSDDYSNLKYINSGENNKNDSKLSIATAIPAAVNQTQTTTLIDLQPSAPHKDSASNSLSLQQQQQQYSSLNPADRLVSMGFCNRQLNAKLLNKYNDDVQKVIEDLLNRQDNNWASNRH